MAVRYTNRWTDIDQLNAEDRGPRYAEMMHLRSCVVPSHKQNFVEVEAEVDLSFLLKEFTTNENPDRAAT